MAEQAPPTAPTRADSAADFEDVATHCLGLAQKAARHGKEYCEVGQLAATLALGQRVADLTDRLEQSLGGVDELPATVARELEAASDRIATNVWEAMRK